jgi:hypothetical protein
MVPRQIRVAQVVKKFTSFCGNQWLTDNTYEPNTCPYPMLDPNHTLISFYIKIHFNIILSCLPLFNTSRLMWTLVFGILRILYINLTLHI